MKGKLLVIDSFKKRFNKIYLSGIGAKEDVVVHLGCSSEVGLAFESGSITLKNCTILVNNKQSGISAKVFYTIY